MKYCPKCGKNFSDSGRFCGTDGTVLVESNVETQMNAPVSSSAVVAHVSSDFYQKIEFQSVPQNYPLRALIMFDNTASRAFYPNDKLSGWIKLEAQADVRVREVSVVLCYQEQYTSKDQRRETVFKEDEDGRTYRDYEYIAHEIINFDTFLLKELPLVKEEIITGSTSRNLRFDFRIPKNAMPNYSGKIINAAWSVKVVTRLETGKIVLGESYFPVAVSPPGNFVQSGYYGTQTIEDEQKVKMRFLLPKLEYTEGERISGRLIVESLEKLKLSDIELRISWQEKVEVVRQENSGGAGSEIFKIAQNAELQAGSVASFDFEMPINSDGRPTRISPTKINHCTFLINAQINKKAWIKFNTHKEPQVSAEIYLYNGNKK
ncbi:hypothetical protein BH10ACI1_BH10ACI1_24180 [soil metagenome]